VVSHDIELLKVWSDELPRHPEVAAREAHYRAVIAPQVGPVLSRTNTRIIRKYNRESPLGALITDVMRSKTNADVAITNAGGLRADIPAGDIDRGRVLDVFPFLNEAVLLEMTGADLRGAVENGLSLKAGMVQVSGLRATYDLGRPMGSRAVAIHAGERPLDDQRAYRVVTSSFLAEGGDGYGSFKNGRVIARDKQLSELMCDYLRTVPVVEPPVMGRLTPA